MGRAAAPHDWDRPSRRADDTTRLEPATASNSGQEETKDSNDKIGTSLTSMCVCGVCLAWSRRQAAGQVREGPSIVAVAAPTERRVRLSGWGQKACAPQPPPPPKYHVPAHDFAGRPLFALEQFPISTFGETLWEPSASLWVGNGAKPRNTETHTHIDTYRDTVLTSEGARLGDSPHPGRGDFLANQNLCPT